jgi:hypothetical protein
MKTNSVVETIKSATKNAKKFHVETYNQAIRQVMAGSWRALCDASMFGSICGVSVYQFVSVAKQAGFDDEKIVAYRSYTGRGGYDQVAIEDALQRYNWNTNNPHDQVPTTPMVVA